jgi:hypothetical protein
MTEFALKDPPMTHGEQPRPFSKRYFGHQRFRGVFSIRDYLELCENIGPFLPSLVFKQWQ